MQNDKKNDVADKLSDLKEWNINIDALLLKPILINVRDLN